MFKEELLWDLKINSPSEIKQFCSYLLRENIISKEKNYTEYYDGINSFSLDFLESKTKFRFKSKILIVRLCGIHDKEDFRGD